jgi:hypothetical protein
MRRICPAGASEVKYVVGLRLLSNRSCLQMSKLMDRKIASDVRGRRDNQIRVVNDFRSALVVKETKHLHSTLPFFQRFQAFDVSTCFALFSE